MDSLIATKQIIKIKDYKNSTLVKVTPRVKSIETLPQTVKVKKDEITQWSTKLLDNDEGHAIKNKIGREIPGFIR